MLGALTVSMSLLICQKPTCNQLPQQQLEETLKEPRWGLTSPLLDSSSIPKLNMRIQLKRCEVEPKATASALSVLRTTRAIFLDDHATGQMTVLWFAMSLPSVAKINVPCRDAEPLLDSQRKHQKMHRMSLRVPELAQSSRTPVWISLQTEFGLHSVDAPPCPLELQLAVHRLSQKFLGECALQQTGAICRSVEGILTLDPDVDFVGISRGIF